MASRREVVSGLAACAAALGLSRDAAAQDYAPPRITRYKVEGATMWMRDLVIEDASNYAVYEARNGPFYGRGTYSFNGQSVQFVTGPFYTMGYRGSSTIEPDGKHKIRLGPTADAISLD